MKVKVKLGKTSDDACSWKADLDWKLYSYRPSKIHSRLKCC